MLYNTIIGGGQTKTYTTHWGGTCSKAAPYTYTVSSPVTGTAVYEPREVIVSPAPAKDKDSFKKIRQSGAIKMTNYSRSSSDITNFLGTVPRYSVLISAPHCLDWNWSEYVELIVPYQEQGDIVYWTRQPYIGNARDSVIGEWRSVLAELMSDVVADNLNTYDLLTELAESKELLALLFNTVHSVRKPLQAFANFRRSLMKSGKYSPGQIKEMVESKWMEYRYAIMPVIYSIKDISELLEKRNDLYKTSRAKRTLTFDKKRNWDGNYNDKPIWLYRETTGTVTIRVTGKALYDVGALKLRLFDQVGLNPFVTAWELLPFSFVVDWFANIGDWVLAQTSSLVDFSQQRVFCYSVKQDFVVETFLHYNLRAFADKIYDDVHKYHWETTDSGTHLLQRNVVKDFRRTLFVPNEVSLNFEPFLNWKRSLDSWVLLQRPLQDALRRLK